MANAKIKQDEVRLHALVDSIAQKVVDQVHFSSDQPVQMELCFHEIREEFDLTLRTSDKTQVVHFHPSDDMIRYRYAIMPLLAKRLKADDDITDYTHAHSTAAAAAAAATTWNGGLPYAGEPEPTSTTSATLPNLLFPPIASLMAMRDEREKAKAARKKATKDAFDRETLEYLQQRISKQEDIKFVEMDGKNGYVVSIARNIVIAGTARWLDDFRNIIPLMQASIGPAEKVTWIDGFDACIQVMEI